MANTLRVLFASYNHLPFFLVGWDATHHQPLFAGHFGFVDPSGQTASGMPAFKTRYADYEPGYPGRHVALRRSAPPAPPRERRHERLPLRPGGSGGVLRRGPPQQARRLLPPAPLLNFSSEDLVNGGSNMFEIQPDALTPGDALFERWQAQGIGHTIPVFQVDSTTYPGKLAPSVAKGSMPRRQPLWDGPLDAREYFTNDETEREISRLSVDDLRRPCCASPCP